MTVQRQHLSLNGAELLATIETAYSATRQPLGYKALTDARQEVVQLAQTCAQAGEQAMSCYWLGRIALDSDEPKRAILLLQQAISMRPKMPEGHFQLGHALLADRRHHDALDAFANAVALDATATRADFAMGYTLMQMGRDVEAFGIMRRVIRRFPNDAAVRATLFQLLKRIQPDSDESGLASDALWWLSFADAPFDDLGQFISVLLLHRYRHRPMVNVMAKDKLLLQALSKTHFASADFESLLIEVRRSLFVSALADNHISEEGLTLALALFLQCRMNEGVWSYTEDEATLLDNLESLIDQAYQARLMKGDICALLVLYGMYEPAKASQMIPMLMKMEGSWPSWAHKAMTEICDEEQALMTEHSEMSEQVASDAVGNKVRQQYEQWPYPRWQHLDWAEKVPFAEAIKRTFKLHWLPECLSMSPMPVLVAGCGTGRHALTVAKHFTDTKVTAIDLSSSSLAWAKMKARQYQVDNVQFQQLDILQLEQLPSQFALIECSGVLHHMESAEAGLQALCGKLLPHGMLKVAVYSKAARQHIIELRAQLSELSGQASDIRRQREKIMAHSGDQWTGVLHSRDFFSLSGTKDLLLNEHETHFSVRSLIEMIQRNHLEPVGLVLDATMQKNWLQHFGTLPDATDFERWAQLEVAMPNTFNSMIQLYSVRAY